MKRSISADTHRPFTESYTVEEPLIVMGPSNVGKLGPGDCIRKSLAGQCIFHANLDPVTTLVAYAVRVEVAVVRKLGGSQSGDAVLVEGVWIKEDFGFGVKAAESH